jgi:type I restriction enzyme S subunit
VESEMGMIPKGWRVGKLDELVEIIDGDRGTNYPSHQDFSQSGYCLFLNAGNVSKVGFNFSTNNFISKEKDKILRKGKLSRYDMYLQQEGQSEISVIWENLYHLIIFE